MYRALPSENRKDRTMAEKNTPKHSGFEAPTYGTVVPDGYTMVKQKNGNYKMEPVKKDTKKTTGKMNETGQNKEK